MELFETKLSSLLKNPKETEDFVLFLNGFSILDAASVDTNEKELNRALTHVVCFIDIWNNHFKNIPPPLEEKNYFKTILKETKHKYSPQTALLWNKIAKNNKQKFIANELFETSLFLLLKKTELSTLLKFIQPPLNEGVNTRKVVSFCLSFDTGIMALNQMVWSGEIKNNKEAIDAYKAEKEAFDFFLLKTMHLWIEDCQKYHPLVRLLLPLAELSNKTKLLIMKGIQKHSVHASIEIKKIGLEIGKHYIQKDNKTEETEEMMEEKTQENLQITRGIDNSCIQYKIEDENEEDLENIKTHFIQDCIEILTAENKKEIKKKALQSLCTKIQQAPLKTVKREIKGIVKIVLYLEDNDMLRHLVIKQAILFEPETVCGYLGTLLFSTKTSMSQKCDILSAAVCIPSTEETIQARIVCFKMLTEKIFVDRLMARQHLLCVRILYTKLQSTFPIKEITNLADCFIKQIAEDVKNID